MRSWFIVLSTLVLCSLGNGDALAGGREGTVGVGAEYQLSGLGGASLNYDGGTFHVGGFFGLSDDGGRDDTNFEIGGRFYYHVHSTAMSDFGIGGSLGIASIGDRNPREDDDTTELFLEPGVQLRAFIAGNVAISVSTGLAIGLADADNVRITGQPAGAAGVHYYFF